MLTRLKRYFTAPILDDPVQTRLTGLLNAVLATTSLAGGLAMPAVIWLSGGRSRGPLAAATAALLVGNGLLYALGRAGRVRRASLLLPALHLGVLTYALLYLGGADSPAITGYLVIILAAGLLLGRAGAVLFAAASALAALGLWQFESAGRLPVEAALPPVPAAIIHVAVFAAAGALLYLAAGRMQEGIDAARELNEHLAAERKRARQMELLADVARRLTGLHDLRQLMDESVRRLNQDFGYEHVSLMLVEEEVLRARAVAGVFEHLAALREPIPLGRGIAGWVGQTGQVWLANDAQSDERFAPTPGMGVGAEMAAPLRLGKSVIGVLSVTSRRPGAFDEADARTLQSLADLLAAALQAGRLLDELRARERLAEALRRVGQAASASLELPVVLETIVAESCAVFEVDAATIWLVEADEMCIAAAHGFQAAPILGVRFQVTDPTLIAAHAVRTQRAVIVNDVPGSGQGPQRIKDLVPAQAVLAIPIVREGVTQAALVIIDTRQTQRFTSQDAAAAELLGAQLAAAVHNARLFSEAQHRAQQLAVLNSLAHEMTGLVEAADLCRYVAASLHERLGYSSAAVFSVDERAQVVVLEAIAGAHAHRVEPGKYRQEFGQGLIGTAAQSGELVLANDAREHPAFYQLEGMEVRAELVLPLRAGGRVSALLTVASDTPGAFTPEDVVTLKTVGGQLALALEKARYVADTRRRAQELAALYDTALATSGELEPRALLRRIAEHVHSLLAPDAIGIALYDAEREEIELALAVEHGQPLEDAAGLRLPAAAGGLTGWVMRNREPLFVDDLEHEALPAEPLNLTLPARAWLGAPLIARGEVIGAISAQSFRPGAFDERDRFLMLSLAGQIAIALENARLYQSVQQQAAELGALYRASAALFNAGEGLEAVAENIAQTLTEEFDFTHCDVRLLDEAGQGLSLAAQAGSFEVSCPPLRLDGAGIVAEAARSGRPVYYADVATAPSYLPGHGLTRSELAVPLHAGGRLLGVLNLESPELDAFPERARRIVSAFAERAALALENVRLIEAERKRAQQLGLLYEVSRQVTTTLEAEAIARLAAQALVDQFGYTQAAIMAPAGEAELELAVSVAREEMGVAPGFRQRRDEGVIGRAVETGRAYLANDISVDPYYFNPAGRQQGSALAIPLLREQHLLGVLYIEDVKAGAFSANDVQALETLAGQIATALDNAQLYGQVRHRLREMTGLQSMAQAVSSSLDLDEIFQTAVLLLHDIFGYRYVSLALLEGDVLRLAAQIGFDGRTVFPTLPITQGISGRAARTGRPQFVRDVRDDPDYVAGALEVESEIAVPLVKELRVLGVLNVGSPPERPLTEGDVNLLLTLAGQISVAIENARLYQAEREQRDLAETLRAASIALSTTLDYDTVLDLLLEQIGRRVPYDAAVVLDVRGGVTRAARLRGYERFGPQAQEAARASRFDLRLFPILEAMVQERRPRVVPATRAEPDWRPRAGLEHIESWVGAPVTVQEGVIAILSLEKTEPGFYRQEHGEWLAAFAGHAALALQNARLFEAAERRAAELEGLRQASLSLTASLEPREVLEAVLEGAFQLLPGLGNAHIFLYQDEQLTFGAARWADRGRREPWSEPRPLGLTYTVARSGEALVIPDMRRHPLFADARPEWTGAIVGLPLKIGARVVGVMNASYTQPREFEEAELRLLRLLGAQAAVAIENGRLFQAEREQRGLAEALRDVSHALNATLDLASILDRVLEELAHILPYDSSAVMMIEGDYYRMVGGRNLAQPESIGSARFPLSNALAQALTENRRPIVIADAQADSRFAGWAGAAYVRGWIGVPLISRDKVIGALTVDSTRAGAYTERDAELAFAFASQAAIAIENARLYADIQARAEMLAALNATALDISIPHDLPELLHTIVERAARLLQAPGGGLYLADPERREVRGLVSYNTQRDDTGRVFAYGEGPAGQVARTGRPLLLAARREAQAAPDAAEAEAQASPASVSAPMVWLGHVTGVITVEDSREGREFSPTDLETLTQFARQAAIAVENARLLAETQRREKEQRLLFDAARDFTAGLDEAGVLKAVARHMAAALRVNDCVVSRWDRAGDLLVTLLDYDQTAEPEPVPPGTVYSLEDFPATRRVLHTRQPLIVRADDPAAPPTERALLEEAGHGMELMVPLATGDRVFGLVELFRPVGAPTFTVEEVELALSLSAQAATGLENASLHTVMSERARELDALVTANTALLSTLDLDLLLRNVLQAALDAIPPAEKGAILLVDPATGELVMRAVIGYGDPRVQRVKFTGRAGYSARALRERAPQLIRDAWADSAIRYTGEIQEMREIRSAVAAPLLVKNEARGVLSLDSTQPAAFGEADVRLLAAFATTAAAAIDNAQLHAEVQTLAITDSLTGLMNRREFDRALETELSRAIRYGYPLTLIILDIDNFKEYNDTYGHPAGDRRLVAIAGLLRANVRDPDLAARYGGEEFGLILPHTDKAGALALAERIRTTAEAAAARRGPARGPLAGFTLSLGVATYPDDASSAEELLQAADSAELEAKRSGKNQVRAAPALRDTR